MAEGEGLVFKAHNVRGLVFEAHRAGERKAHNLALDAAEGGGRKHREVVEVVGRLHQRVRDLHRQGVHRHLMRQACFKRGNTVEMRLRFSGSRLRFSAGESAELGFRVFG